MRTDHVQNFNRIAEGLALAARALIEENQKQINSAKLSLPLLDQLRSDNSADLTDADSEVIITLASKWRPKSSEEQPEIKKPNVSTIGDRKTA